FGLQSSLLKMGLGRYTDSVRAGAAFLWDAYSKPSPCSIWEFLSLLFVCFSVSCVTGGFLFQWLFGVLKYGYHTSGAATGLYMISTFVVIVLVHPLRCVLTITLPTVGTAQGRKVILSACVMLVLLNIVPNVAANVGAVIDLLKCTSRNVAHSFLNSSELMNLVKGNMVNVAVRAVQDQFSLVQSLKEFDQLTHIDVFKVMQRFRSVSEHIAQDFFQAFDLVQAAKLVANRTLAAFLVLYLFTESACYLKSYLISVKFDNHYITGQLKEMASENQVLMRAGDVKGTVDSSSCRIAKQELLSCLVPLAVVTLYFTLTIIVIGLDFLVYHLVTASVPWLLHIPPIEISLNVFYKVEHCYDGCLLFHDNCCRESPNRGVVFLLSLLFGLSYLMAFLEVYACRLRRKVAASFFRRQEKRRVDFLFKKFLAKQRGTDNGVYFIQANVSRNGVCDNQPSSQTGGHIELVHSNIFTSLVKDTEQ
uniref:Dendritic cell-specific transmembrane protein-like domain-containing protein n=1 Tax=Denticeps clupeoides TaxID=299321 RepID=A0AAY4BBW6_9TELE